MSYTIKDRKAVAQIKYQLNRFKKQCAELPEEAQQRIEQELYGFLLLLGEWHEEDYPEGR